MRPAAPPHDSLARLYGDECEGLHHVEQAAGVAARLHAAPAEPFVVGDVEISVGASINIAYRMAHAEGGDPDLLLHQADMAMYAAKRSGSRQLSVFAPLHREAGPADPEPDLRNSLNSRDIIGRPWAP